MIPDSKLVASRSPHQQPVGASQLTAAGTRACAAEKISSNILQAFQQSLWSVACQQSNQVKAKDRKAAALDHRVLRERKASC